jgi:hypothetical protein
MVSCASRRERRDAHERWQSLRGTLSATKQSHVCGNEIASLETRRSDALLADPLAMTAEGFFLQPHDAVGR